MIFPVSDFRFPIAVGVAFFLFLTAGCGPEKDREAMVQTSMGDIRIRLHRSAPEASRYFIRMAEAGRLDTLLFHYVSNDFVLDAAPPGQLPAGLNDFLSDQAAGEFPEGGLPLRGSLAFWSKVWERPPGETSPDFEFFIVEGLSLDPVSLENWETQRKVQFSPDQQRRLLERGGLPALNRRCIVFGEVVEGMEVVDRIAAVPRDAGGRPLKNISLKIRLLNDPS